MTSFQALNDRKVLIVDTTSAVDIIGKNGARENDDDKNRYETSKNDGNVVDSDHQDPVAEPEKEKKESADEPEAEPDKVKKESAAEPEPEKEKKESAVDPKAEPEMDEPAVEPEAEPENSSKEMKEEAKPEKSGESHSSAPLSFHSSGFAFCLALMLAYFLWSPSS